MMRRYEFSSHSFSRGATSFPATPPGASVTQERVESGRGAAFEGGRPPLATEAAGKFIVCIYSNSTRPWLRYKWEVGVDLGLE